MYIENVTDVQNTRSYALDVLNKALKRKVDIVSARKDSKNRRILIELKHIDDKHDILYKIKTFSNVYFKDYKNDNTEKYEKFHTNFCKYVLHVNKYASSQCSLSELGRYPIKNFIYTQIVKYYLRFEHGLENTILANAYTVAKNENHPFYQCTKNILMVNGMYDVVCNSKNCSIKATGNSIMCRLKDQYRQSTHAYLTEKNRFQSYVLDCDESYSIKEYLYDIKDIQARQIFTKLRMDHSVIKTSLLQKKKSKGDVICICKKAPETLDHFLLKCDVYKEIRQEFNRDLGDKQQYFNKCEDNKKIQILLMTCPLSGNKYYRNSVEKYVTTIYKKRCVCK